MLILLDPYNKILVRIMENLIRSWLGLYKIFNRILDSILETSLVRIMLESSEILLWILSGIFQGKGVWICFGTSQFLQSAM